MTLCIIDMQPYFKTATKSLADRIAQEIRKSQKRREGIILLEYYNLGNTYKNILNELRSYDRQTTIAKYADNGANELLAAARSLRFNMSHFRICGVNTCACVRETFWGVHNRTEAKVTLLSDLVNCECKGSDCTGPYRHSISDRVRVQN